MTQDSPDMGRETSLFLAGDRQIVVRKPTDLQMLYMAREARYLSKDNSSTDRKLQAAATIMDILESAIVQAEDVDHVRQLVLQGKFDLPDMMNFITVFVPSAPTTGPTVSRGRGRPRKSPSA